IVGLSFTLAVAQRASAQTVCNGDDLPAQAILLPLPSQQPDLRVTGKCTVQPSDKGYYYANVNILDKGELTFAETKGSRTDLWVGSIIIEKGGSLTAGSTTHPFGEDGGALTIHLYGKDSVSWNPNTQKFTTQNAGAPCKSDPGTPSDDNTPAPCGIPQTEWE